MTTINALAEIAEDLTGLTAVDSPAGVGIQLTFTVPKNSNIDAIEIYASFGNNRANAVLVTTIVGTKYFFPALPNRQYYFWGRGVTRYGLANGNYFPLSATAGVPAKALELLVGNYSFIAPELVGDGTEKLAATVDVINPTARILSISIAVGCVQTYSGGAVSSSFVLKKYDQVAATLTTLKTLGTFADKVHTPNFIYPAHDLTAAISGVPSEIQLRLYWTGAAGVSIAANSAGFVINQILNS
jgi:hypothetical protein